MGAGADLLARADPRFALTTGMELDPQRWRAASAYLDDALDLDDDSRADWIAALSEREPALATDVRALLEQHRALAGERFLESTPPHPIAAPALAGQTLGPYTILDAIGQGGMGSVWRAERNDGRFERLAAIKFLNIGLMGRRGQERFTREGRIVACLTHPHIALLLDAGVSAWGQPYLVLEYVDGEPIDRYCDRAALDVTGRVRLFLDVVAAVEHAHAHLIVHRDLKPSNVLVSRGGVVKLLDFGIARLLDADPETPTTLSRDGGAGTPAFAAPEQLTGGALTTAVDVYALGALLYLLLTGTHPSGKTPQTTAEVVNWIVEGEPRPMSSFKDVRIPADLETIVTTALKKHPGDRYGSVSALAADLERFRQHQPIAARRDSLVYRSRKFLRRHRVPATLAAVLLMALSFGFFEVNRQRGIAERRFLEVRQLAARLFDIDVPLRGIPGSSKVRQMIVDTSLDYLRRLGTEVHDDPVLELDIGTAYMRVARVQGVPISTNLGQVDEADRNLLKAHQAISAVVARQPSNRLALLRMGQIEHDRMILAGNRRPDDAALPLAREAATWLGRYLDTGPVDSTEGQQVLLAMNNVSNRFRIARQFDEALRWSGRAIEIARSLDQRFQLAGLLQGMAFIHRDRGDLAAALRDAREAAGIMEAMPGEADASRRLNISLALSRAGAILGDLDGISLNRPAEAQAPLLRAFTIADEIAHRDPDDAFSRGRLESPGLLLARIARDADPARALEYYDHLLTHFGEVKNNPQMRRYEIRTEADSAHAWLRLGRIDRARQQLQAAFARLRDLKLYPRDEVAPGSEADDVLRANAAIEVQSGNVAHALDIATTLLAKLMASKPEPQEDLADAVDVSSLYALLTDLNRAARQQANSADYARRRVQLWQQWDRKLPGNPFVRDQLNTALAASASDQAE